MNIRIAKPPMKKNVDIKVMEGKPHFHFRCKWIIIQKGRGRTSAGISQSFPTAR